MAVAGGHSTCLCNPLRHESCGPRPKKAKDHQGEADADQEIDDPSVEPDKVLYDRAMKTCSEKVSSRRASSCKPW